MIEQSGADLERALYADRVRESLGEHSVFAGIIDGTAFDGVTNEFGLEAVHGKALAELDEWYDQETAENRAAIYAGKEARFMIRPEVQEATGVFCQVMDTYASTVNEIHRRVDGLYRECYWSDGRIHLYRANELVHSVNLPNGNTVQIMGVNTKVDEHSLFVDALHVVVLTPADSGQDAEELMRQDLKEMRPVFDVPPPTEEEIEAGAFESYVTRLRNIASDNALYIGFWQKYFKAEIRERGFDIDTESCEGKALKALYPDMDFSTGHLYGKYSDAVVGGVASRLNEDGTVDFVVTVGGDEGLGESVRLTHPIFDSTDWRLEVERSYGPRSGWELVARSEQISPEGRLCTQVEWRERIPETTRHGNSVFERVEQILTGDSDDYLTDIAWVRSMVERYALVIFAHAQNDRQLKALA